MARKLYDPQLIPERDIHEKTYKKLEGMMGTKCVSRGPTERYIMTCVCGTYQITSDNNAHVYFTDTHRGCN